MLPDRPEIYLKVLELGIALNMPEAVGRARERPALEDAVARMGVAPRDSLDAVRTGNLTYGALARLAAQLVPTLNRLSKRSSLAKAGRPRRWTTVRLTEEEVARTGHHRAAEGPHA